MEHVSSAFQTVVVPIFLHLRDAEPANGKSSNSEYILVKPGPGRLEAGFHIIDKPVLDSGIDRFMTVTGS